MGPVAFRYPMRTEVYRGHTEVYRGHTEIYRGHTEVFEYPTEDFCEFCGSRVPDRELL